MVFRYFCYVGHVMLDEQIKKNQSKNQSKLRCKLGWILDGSWVDFWWILSPSWEVSWGQVGIKIL